jgi:hypothetical protein
MMTRAQLEHIIRAAGAIADTGDIIVVGSQSVLGEFPDAPSELLVSDEADVFPATNPALGDLIDGTIGEGSPFQRSFGYYAHGVDETTSILPEGWRDRLILVSGENTGFIRGWCLEIHDLAIAKYVAGREKDRLFTKALAKHAMVRRELMEQRLTSVALNPVALDTVLKRIQTDFGAGDENRTRNQQLGRSLVD